MRKSVPLGLFLLISIKNVVLFNFDDLIIHKFMSDSGLNVDTAITIIVGNTPEVSNA